MTEYVKKSEVLDTLWKADGITYHGIEVLNHMPAEDVVQRETLEQVYWERDTALQQLAEIGKGLGQKMSGQWIGEADEYADGYPVYDIWSCSCCGKYFDEWDEKPDWNFCPHCGARMEVPDGR